MLSFAVSNKISITSTSPRDGTIVKKGEDIRLSCKTNPQWFFCVWKGPGEIKQVYCKHNCKLHKYDSTNYYLGVYSI